MVTNIITKIKKINVYQGIQNTNQTYRNTFKKKKREQLIHKNTNKDTDKHLLCLKRSCTSISPRHFSIQENVWVAVSILPLNTSNSCIVVNTSSFQGTYSKPLTFIIKKKKSKKWKVSSFIQAWRFAVLYDWHRKNIMLYNSMTDRPRAIQMRELITMLAKEISY